MSVVGVDFGTLNTVIAVARNRGVDVVSIPIASYLLGHKLILVLSRSQMKSLTELHRKSKPGSSCCVYANHKTLGRSWASAPNVVI